MFWGGGAKSDAVTFPSFTKTAEFSAGKQVSDPPHQVRIAVKENVASQEHLKELLKIDPVRGKSRITHRRKFLYYTHN